MPFRTQWPGYAPWAATVAECQAEFIRVARSFWLIPEIIPPIAREDIGLLYCFCRRLDDAIDEAPDSQRARAALTAWRAELEGRAPPRPLIAALLAGAPRSELPLQCAHYLLEGMELDLGEVRIADDAELLRYAYRVSSSVGLMLAPLLGVEGREAAQRVIDLGLALQLTNILLGVEGDARRGRVYLPASRLRAAGLEFDEVLARPADSRLRPVLAGVAELADRYYRSAELGAARVPLRYRHGVLLLGQVYGELGRSAARGERAPPSPAGLPWRSRVRHLVLLGLRGASPRINGFARVPAHDPELHRALAGFPGANA